MTATQAVSMAELQDKLNPTQYSLIASMLLASKMVDQR
jgi:hypothetical protein